MGFIILEDKDGNRRKVPSGKQINPPKRSDEKIVGTERNGKHIVIQSVEERKEQYGKFVLLANLFGMGIAEFITFAAKALKIPPCPSCERRAWILRRMGELGIRTALWMLFQTFREQFGKGLGFGLSKKILVLARDLLGGKKNGTSSS